MRLLFSFVISLLLLNPSSIHAQTTQESEESDIVISYPRRLEVDTSQPVRLLTQPRDPGGRRMTYQWTQIAGPEVELRWGADSPNEMFFTPEEDAVIVLRLTVSNGVTTTFRDMTIDVESFESRRARLHAGPGPSEGNSSTLRVESTSLIKGAIWGRTDTKLEINFTSESGAVLQEGFLVRLFRINNDITEMFYSPEENKVALLPDRAPDFSLLLQDRYMSLSIVGSDSLGDGVGMDIPLFNGRFQILGKVVFAADVEPRPLEGHVLTLRGNNLNYTAMTTLDAEGNFSFDNLPGDTYFMKVETWGLSTSTLVVLDEEKSDIVNVFIEAT